MTIQDVKFGVLIDENHIDSGVYNIFLLANIADWKQWEKRCQCV